MNMPTLLLPSRPGQLVDVAFRTHLKEARCYNCDGPAEEGPYRQTAFGRRFQFFRCRHCTHLFIYPHFTSEEVALIFSDEYFAEGGAWADGIFEGSYEDARPKLEKEALLVLDMFRNVTGKDFFGLRILEIGCAGGTFLDVARTHGAETVGIEPNRKMADRTREAGHDVFCGTVESIPLDQFEGEFDLVVLMDVLEHVQFPRKLMNRISRWSRSASHILIRGPVDMGRPLNRASQFVRRSLGIPKDLGSDVRDAHHWNLRSLKTFLGRGDFEIDEIRGATATFANIVASRGAS